MNNHVSLTFLLQHKLISLARPAFWIGKVYLDLLGELT